MTTRGLLLGAFFVSGASGLAYELIWSHYLALLLGHGAYAQIVVIAVYLGGMALGATAVGQRSARLRRPLAWYVRAELALAALGLLFHPIYRSVAGFAYDVLLPGTSGTLSAVVPWALSVLLLLPPSVLLGATFPLMAAGLLRRRDTGEGRSVADAYLFNALGGAVGVLVAGFLLVPLLGTVGALMVAAGGNLAAAGTAWRAARIVEPEGTPVGGNPPLPRRDSPDDAPAPGWERPGARRGAGGSASGAAPSPAVPVVLCAAFFTAVASFGYEIGWIRMLSLVMGSSAHSFEIMLSAFILGLAGGSWLIRDRVDGTATPIRLLGSIQWLMGLAALATLPVYALSFDTMGAILSTLPREGPGFVTFNVARYGLALIVMLPATVLAGATLPLLTGILLHREAGERAVGWVYGANTLGAVVGVVVAGLILLPALGLEGMLVAAACLDMAVGVALLAWSVREGEGTSRTSPVAGAVAAAGAALAVASLVHLDRAMLTGGVFRYGGAPHEDGREVVFYDDGRTATVGVHLHGDPPLMVLTTNGKPDASLPVRWIRAAMGEDLPPEPLRAVDAATQTLSALTLLAHHPRARSALNVGHGSGMSVAALLATRGLESVVTVEIEPAVVRASRSFLPANRRAFTDSRHGWVLDDARAHLARSDERWDLILSEPSNPWVAGTATLFTTEFYRHARRHLAPGGVFGQWLQLYEIDDALVASALKSLHEVFPAYRAYLVGSHDLLVVAGDGTVDLRPDWRVFDTPGLRADLAHLPPFTADHLSSLEAFQRDDVAPLLDTDAVRPNSDFHLRLAHGAERARYERREAEGIRGLATDRFDVPAALGGRARRPSSSYTVPPVWSIETMRQGAAAAWLGEIRRGERRPATPPFPEWRPAYRDHLLLVEGMARDQVPPSWNEWIRDVHRAEAVLHGGTAAYADAPFYDEVRAYLDRVDAPDVARAAVDLVEGLAAWEWVEAADAVDRLRDPEAFVDSPVDPGLLMDGGAVAYLKTGRPDDALRLLEEMGSLTGRSPADFRTRLLRAHAERALAAEAF